MVHLKLEHGRRPAQKLTNSWASADQPIVPGARAVLPGRATGSLSHRSFYSAEA